MPEVIVYSKPSCVQCTSTYRSFDKNGILYTVVNVVEDAVALERIRAMGYMQAPVVEVIVDGQPVDHWSGFRPDKTAIWKAHFADQPAQEPALAVA